ncbi:MAG TPA: acetyl-CoA carboxylase carboxyltransferase subunit alpha [Thermomicrobiales bacterium]|nr:acetyl-CoA carboxylase carboxyltransferase subunit alpha [Thermomicrobiales bacterium]
MTDSYQEQAVPEIEGSAPEETPELSAMDRVRLARHPERPATLDYIRELFTHFVELRGDRNFGDDKAMIGGLATFRGRSVVVLGHQGGTNTRENIERNFGMPRPEGFRKARRLMQHAEKFGLPILTFVDTSGADPGITSEERGQATAIAECLMQMIGTKVPIVCTVIGEGGSGGALAISLGDRLLMLENAVYAVASPEACAAILWKDAGKASEAAETMRVTAADLERFGIIDELIPELVPAHEAPRDTIQTVGNRIAAHLDDLCANLVPSSNENIDELLDRRYDKFRVIGAWSEDGISN